MIKFIALFKKYDSVSIIPKYIYYSVKKIYFTNDDKIYVNIGRTKRIDCGCYYEEVDVNYLIDDEALLFSYNDCNFENINDIINNYMTINELFLIHDKTQTLNKITLQTKKYFAYSFDAILNELNESRT